MYLIIKFYYSKTQSSKLKAFFQIIYFLFDLHILDFRISVFVFRISYFNFSQLNR